MPILKRFWNDADALNNMAVQPHANGLMNGAPEQQQKTKKKKRHTESNEDGGRKHKKRKE